MVWGQGRGWLWGDQLGDDYKTFRWEVEFARTWVVRDLDILSLGYFGTCTWRRRWKLRSGSGVRCELACQHLCGISLLVMRLRTYICSRTLQGWLSVFCTLQWLSSISFLLLILNTDTQWQGVIYCGLYRLLKIEKKHRGRELNMIIHSMFACFGSDTIRAALSVHWGGRLCNSCASRA